MTILHVGSRRSADLLLSHFMFTLEVQGESLVQIEPVGRVKVLEFRKHERKAFVENKLLMYRDCYKDPYMYLVHDYFILEL